MIEENNIPKNWKWLKLGDACEIVSGNTPKGLENISNQGNIQFYKVSDMNLVGNEIKMNISNLKLTTEEIINLKIKVYPKGTVIFPKRGGAILTNKKRILSQNASFDLNLMGIIPNDKVLSTFLFYWFQKLDLGRIYDGSNVPQINNKNVAPLDFPIPPIGEQQTIVFKIEELLSDLENGKQQLQIAQQQLKIYRQSLLKWAYEGKLTNKNVIEGELPEGWKQVKIKDVAETSGGYAFKSGEFLNKGKYQVLRMGNVRPGIIRFNESPIFLNDVDVKVLNHSLLQLHDVIITQTGTRQKRDYGFTVLISKTNLLLNQRIASIRFNKVYLPKFFLYFSWTDAFKDQFFANETGNVGQGNVGMKAVTETSIPFCTINEQQLIVDELESKLTVCDKIEETISQSLLHAESLKQSILKKAFEGKLV